MNACFTKMKENIRNKKRRWNIIDVIDENYLDATFKITSTMLLELQKRSDNIFSTLPIELLHMILEYLATTYDELFRD